MFFFLGGDEIPIHVEIPGLSFLRHKNQPFHAGIHTFNPMGNSTHIPGLFQKKP